MWKLGKESVILPKKVTMSEAEIQSKLDETDTNEIEMTAEEKWPHKNEFIPVCPEKWIAKGVRPDLAEKLKGIHPPVADPAPAPQDFGFYPWKSADDAWAVAKEMKRCSNRGGMRWAEPGEPVTFIHPHVIVHQGKGKVRACHDYSVGLNKHVGKWPFRLPRVWDLRKWIKKGSYFWRADLSDGFWFTPIGQESQRYFGVRHPWVRVPEGDSEAHLPGSAAEGLIPGQWHPDSGKVALCTRVPFGYSLAPAEFCSLTEELARILRDDYGLNVIAYVDDFGGVADTYEEALAGMATFEKFMAELGVPVSPWKTCGPSRHMTFLGLQLTNIEGCRAISLPEDKLKKAVSQMKELKRDYRPGSVVKPERIAKLLGLLNFASQVVEGGPVFLDRMYNQFRGVIVDWKRGLVRVGGKGSQMRVKREFFDDLDWWLENLVSRSAVNLMPRHGRDKATIGGSDASGWGAGQLAWLSGEREEVQMKHTEWERSQPVNFRELVGAVRIVERWGPRLQGMQLRIETDNMACMWCIKRHKARTRSMAEQLRRLYTMAARWDIEVAIVHTPGKLLVQNDAVSRGKDPEKPR